MDEDQSRIASEREAATLRAFCVQQSAAIEQRGRQVRDRRVAAVLRAEELRRVERQESLEERLRERGKMVW